MSVVCRELESLASSFLAIDGSDDSDDPSTTSPDADADGGEGLIHGLHDA